MLNVLIAGIGGQGSVLASKILAQAASAKGWQVRTAETIGMAQRGGNVTSHVRMGDGGEEVFAPLIPRGCADCIIALEPGEALRVLPYLAPGGLVVTATTPVASVVDSLAGRAYEAAPLLGALRSSGARVVAVDDAAVCDAAGSRKVANVALLAAAVLHDGGSGLHGAIARGEFEAALRACVKPRFVEANLAAVEAAALQASGSGR